MLEPEIQLGAHHRGGSAKYVNALEVTEGDQEPDGSTWNSLAHLHAISTRTLGR